MIHNCRGIEIFFLQPYWQSSWVKLLMNWHVCLSVVICEADQNSVTGLNTWGSIQTWAHGPVKSLNLAFGAFVAFTWRDKMTPALCFLHWPLSRLQLQRHQGFRKYSTVQGITHQMSKLPFDQMRYRYKETFQRNYKFLQRSPGSIKQGLTQLGSLQPATHWLKTRWGHFEGKSINAGVNRKKFTYSTYGTAVFPVDIVICPEESHTFVRSRRWCQISQHKPQELFLPLQNQKGQ